MSTKNLDDIRAMVRDAYENAPVEDADRSNPEEYMGRQVIAESPAPWPRDARTDFSVKLPVRVVVTSGVGVALEVGPYDFDDVSVQMLKQAIALYERCNGGPEVKR